MEHQVEIKNFGMESDSVRLYSFVIDGYELMEFERFLKVYKDKPEFAKDFGVILARIRKILEDSANDRHFRYEGTRRDRVMALPAQWIETSRLRVYCLKLSDNILVMGNGGEKNVQTYQEDPHLNDCVVKLQEIDRYLRDGERRMKIQRNGKELEGELTFNIVVP